jgi:hypothetical protein
VGFGRVESLINELVRQLFGLRGLLYLLLLANIDLRKKLDLMRIGFKHQGMSDHSDILSRVHKLADIRNAVAHGSFYYEPVYKGIIFDDFVGKAGELRLPHKPKGQPKYIDDNLVIAFDEFDKFDEEAAALYDYLTDLDGSIAPFTSWTGRLRWQRLLRDSKAGIVLNEHIVKDGPTVFVHACRLGAEGIVSKKADGTYRSGLCPVWIKVRNPASIAVGLLQDLLVNRKLIWEGSSL